MAVNTATASAPAASTHLFAAIFTPPKNPRSYQPLYAFLAPTRDDPSYDPHVPSPPVVNRRQRWFEHPGRTALAAVISLVVARWIGLPEAYWAPLTTLVVTQSSLRAAWGSSSQRLAGTALGAVVGAIIAAFANASLASLAVGIFALGILCAALKLGNNAFRLAGITLIIVLIIPHAHAPWLLAWQRFLEVAIGIAVALGLTVAWPEGAAGN